MLPDSTYLSDAERRELTAEKRKLNERYEAARSDGERQRLWRQINTLAAKLEDDANDRLLGGDGERDAMGIEACRAAAAKFGTLGSTTASGPSTEELRDFMTPGSATRDLWVTPPREIVQGPVSRFAGKHESTRAAFLTTDTGTIGSAYYFTTDLYRNVVMGLLAASGVLEAEPTLLITNHLRDIQVPVLSADATATAGVEGSPATEANPTGGAVTLGHYRFDGKFSVPLEMVMSAEYDLPSLLSTFATRSIANKVAAMLALGNGTTEPCGLFTASAVTVGVTTAVATGPSMNEMVQLTASLGKGYRKSGRMVTSDVLHTSLLQFTDDVGGYYLRTLEGGGETLAGKRLFSEPQADQSGMSSAEVHAVYGDFSGYFVRTTPMLFRRTEDDPLNPQYTFAIWMDAKVADANSLVSLKMAT